MTPVVVLLVLALVAPPLVAAVTDAVDDDGPRPPLHLCGTAQGMYAPNSSYEANLRYLAAALPAKVTASSSSSADVGVAEPPEKVYASAFCSSRHPGDNSSGCAACLAKAFRYAQLLCPYHRHAMVDLRACRVSYHDAYRMEQDVAAIATVHVDVVVYEGMARQQKKSPS
ncbi:hypothetical protein GUJ93_ZPchr0007g3858 [Zizania palustris]|uniref:Gnk2-homologous domain-containing protein n=1 Tax=Zizania palustris TaxID=103762 RepID=A0A8J5QZ44_ZIZPA|nr:hypothetical protein GUJ93_ZPchr2171g28990 [Zizania palustris]KAG8080257.1 hypothetical protein GUJ93_ZPchr0007g3858 [Zizania palustris]